MTTLLDALAALRPGSAFTMAPGDFATLRWQDPDHDQPTLDAVLAKQAELEAEARIDAVKAEASRRIDVPAAPCSLTRVSAASRMRVRCWRSCATGRAAVTRGARA